MVGVSSEAAGSAGSGRLRRMRDRSREARRADICLLEHNPKDSRFKARPANPARDRSQFRVGCGVDRLRTDVVFDPEQMVVGKE